MCADQWGTAMMNSTGGGETSSEESEVTWSDLESEKRGAAMTGQTGGIKKPPYNLYMYVF